MFNSFFAQDVVHMLTPGVTISRGREVEDWGDPTSTPVPNCSAQPASGDRDFFHADGVQYDYTVFMPAGTSVDPRARFRIPRVPGDMLQTRPPEIWSTGLDSDHVRVYLRRRDG